MIERGQLPLQSAPGEPLPALHPLRLTFEDAALEGAFRADWDEASLPQVRVAFALGLALFVGFGLFDVLMVPEALSGVLTVRAAACVGIAIVFGALRTGFVRRHLQPVLAVSAFGAGLAINVMAVLAAGIASSTYYAGLLMVLVYAAAIMRMRTPAVVAVAVGLNVTYLASLALDPVLPVVVAVNNLVFLVSISLILVFAVWMLERSSRRGFGQLRVIEAQAASLADALANVRELSGLIPVCAWCHKVRTDEGYWQKIESYIAARSKAEFSHGMCPDCFARIGLDADDGAGGADERHAGH